MREDIRERVAKLEQRVDDSDKALGLARDSLSKAQIGSVITIILAVIAIAIHFIK